MNRLPDLPGKVRGIVADHGEVRPGSRMKHYTVQCERCFALEGPASLALVKTRFHARTEGGGPRLCPSCRLEVYPECTCDPCRRFKR